MKTHLNLATTDLEKSVSFYSALLGAAPYKVLPDYALFVTEQPGLELALDLSADVRTCSDVHYGLCVESAADVDTAIARLQEANLVSSVEREETCCYANQTKVWTIDPEGRRWEVYTVHEDTDQKDDADTTCCSSDESERSCCVA
jgi:catechol 2,3-dioxygenase-like lactoylglutathione lyase family enzyme